MDTLSVLPDHMERGPASQLLTIRQAGAYCPALGEQHIRHLVNKRRIPVVKIGRNVFVDRRDLDALVEQGREPAVGAGDAS